MVYLNGLFVRIAILTVIVAFTAIEIDAAATKIAYKKSIDGKMNVIKEKKIKAKSELIKPNGTAPSKTDAIETTAIPAEATEMTPVPETTTVTVATTAVLEEIPTTTPTAATTATTLTHIMPLSSAITTPIENSTTETTNDDNDDDLNNDASQKDNDKESLSTADVEESNEENKSIQSLASEDSIEDNTDAAAAIVVVGPAAFDEDVDHEVGESISTISVVVPMNAIDNSSTIKATTTTTTTTIIPETIPTLSLTSSSTAASTTTTTTTTTESNLPVLCTCGVFLASQMKRGSIDATQEAPVIMTELDRSYPCNPIGQKQCQTKCLEVLVQHLPNSANILCATVDRDIRKERAYLFIKNCYNHWWNTNLTAGREYCCKNGKPYQCPLV